MLRIAVAEDDEKQAEKLAGYIRRYEQESGERCEVAFFRDGVDLISDYSDGFDGIFMDIDMPIMNGMTAAEKLREFDESVSLVFVTDLAQYALQGYKVDAMDYLVKPVEYFEFSVELKKMARKKLMNAADFIWIAVQGMHKKIFVSDIIYIDILSHDVHIHTKTEELVYRGTLKDIEEKLDGKPFSRCHNSCIVNLRKVKSVAGDAVSLENTDDKVYISRNRRKKFMSDLADHFASDICRGRTGGGGNTL